MYTETLLEVVEKIEQEAVQITEKLKTSDNRTIIVNKINGKLEIDGTTCTSVRQGDIYIHLVKDNFKYGNKLKTNKLVDGTNMGSRHLIDYKDMDHVQLFSGLSGFKKNGQEINQALIGPVIKSDKRFSITHPEHSIFNIPAGTYQVTYQLDPRTKLRVAD